MNLRRYLVVAAIVATSSVSTALLPAWGASGDPKRGARLYGACAACHSLEPGVHLTGPSLAGLWGTKAASIAGFPRYSKALKSRDFVWDETTLSAWIADPGAFVKGTYMTFGGINDDRARADLIALLRIALAPGGTKSVVAQGLIPASMARGQVPEPVADVPPDQQVTAVRHCLGSYFVVTADGAERSFWEPNLRLKIDSGPTGPTAGKPVLIQSGMQGDRASLVFKSPTELSRFIGSKC